MSSNSSTKKGGEGNTETSPPRQISPAKRWLFVLNNYTQSDIDEIVPTLDMLCKVYGFSKEVGESGTPHLQGYCEFINKVRPRSIGLSKRIHWGDKDGKPCKGSRQDNINYISKDAPIAHSKGIPKSVKLIKPDYDWEQEVLELIKEEPHDRLIFWYWSKEGNKGKTSFCKYLSVKHGAIALSGKSSDMKNGVIQYKETNGLLPELILIPIPKSFNTDYLNYEGIEAIKDMYFYSGKYEGGMVCGNPPHLFVFANEPPDTSKMSGDRWVIRNID